MLGAGALAILLAATNASQADYLVVRADELNTNGLLNQLVMFPNGDVLHLARLYVAAKSVAFANSDTLVYDTRSDSMIARDSVPAYLLLDEPQSTLTIQPATFNGVDVVRQIAIYDPLTRYFYSPAVGFPYSAAALNGADRAIYVGNVEQSYRANRPAMNPFQPDSEADGVPDEADNCIFVANGLLVPDAGGYSQRDTDNDGYGNVCDPDLDNDGAVNFLDLEIMKNAFFGDDVNADLDGDGFVNFGDLNIMKAFFFGPPGPGSLTP